MKALSTVAVAEGEIVVLQSRISLLEEKFELNHPIRAALCEARIKLNQAIKVNRTEPNEVQKNWVYTVESETPL